MASSIIPAGALRCSDKAAQVRHNPQGIDRIAFATSPRFRGPACDRSGGEADAMRDRSLGHLSVPLSAGFAGGQGRACLAPTCGRSSAAGDAERGRSLDPSPRPAGAAVACAARPDASYRLTPARWRAKMLAGQSRASNGAGRWFQAGTALELFWNRQPSDIAVFFERFQRFQLSASRDVRVYVCVQTRTYTRGHFAGTLEPDEFIVRYQIDKGSRKVPERFQLGTVARRKAANGGNPSEINKLEGGYSPLLGGAFVQGCSSTVIRSRVGETFGLALAGGADRAGAGWLELGRKALGGRGSGRSAWSWRNGGFLRVSAGAHRHVGTVMLEGCAQGLGNARFSGSGQMPVRLTRGALVEAPGGADPAQRPPVAPFAAAPAPSMLALERAGFWIGLPILDHGPMRSAAGGRQMWGWTNGSGCGGARYQVAWLATGRGEFGGFLGNRVDGGHVRTGGARVN